MNKSQAGNSVWYGCVPHKENTVSVFFFVCCVLQLSFGTNRSQKKITANVKTSRWERGCIFPWRLGYVQQAAAIFWGDFFFCTQGTPYSLQITLWALLILHSPLLSYHLHFLLTRVMLRCCTRPCSGTFFCLYLSSRPTSQISTKVLSD